MSQRETPIDPFSHLLKCAACRVIDRADGVEDGQLWNPVHYTSASTGDLFSLMRRVPTSHSWIRPR